MKLIFTMIDFGIFSTKNFNGAAYCLISFMCNFLPIERAGSDTL